MGQGLLNFSLFLSRVVFGLYIGVSGAAKIKGEFDNGFGSFANSDFFQMLQPDWLPSQLATWYGYTLPWVEAVFGLLLVLGLFGRAASAVTFLIVVSIAVAKGFYAWDSVPGLGVQFGGPPFDSTVVYAAFLLLLTVVGPGRWSMDAVLFNESKSSTTPKS